MIGLSGGEVLVVRKGVVTDGAMIDCDVSLWMDMPVIRRLKA